MKYLAAALLATSCAAVFSVNAHAASVFTLPSGVRVEIIESPFQKGSIELADCGKPGKACRINGHLAFGVAFGLPKTYVKSISVSFKGQSYALDSSDMFNAWGSRPLAASGVVRYFGGQCSDAKNCEFRGIFSDGAGTFVAEWRIVDGIPMRDLLTDSSDIIDLFMHNIDPPVNE
jgi:hypothetical protein